MDIINDIKMERGRWNGEFKLIPKRCIEEKIGCKPQIKLLYFPLEFPTLLDKVTCHILSISSYIFDGNKLLW